MQAVVERSLVPPIGIIQAIWLAIPAVLIAKNVRGPAVVATVMTGVVLLAAIGAVVARRRSARVRA